MKIELKLTSEGVEDTEKMEAVLRADDLLFTLKQVVKRVKAYEARENVDVGIDGILKSLEIWHLLND